MMIFFVIFIIIQVVFDLPSFIKNKEQPKLFIIYGFLMASSLVVSVLLDAGRRPPGPAEFIELIFKMIGVVK